jgi:hypothetical protein
MRAVAGFVLTAVCTVAAPSTVAAQRAAWDVERAEGPSRSDAALGNGRLTAVVAQDGTVTALRWPNPTFFEHLNHVTARGPAAGPDPRLLPRLGASPTAGLVVAVLWDDGGGPRLLPLSGPGWEGAQLAWQTDTSRVLRWQRARPGLQVTQQAWVQPDKDVLTLRVEVTPSAPVTRLAVVLLAHPAPSARYYPGWPVSDVLGDDPNAADPNGFAAAFDSVGNAVVAVAPGPAQRAAAAVAAAPWRDGVDGDGRALLSALEDHSAVALALGSDRVASVQVGASDDATAVLRPLDAWADAADGVLGGQQVHVGDATVALLVELPVAGASEVAFHVALAASPSEALALLAHARATPVRAALEDADASGAALAREVALPATADPAARALALRSLMILDALEDPQDGAVVVSAAAQPFAAHDRPGDTAWVDLAHAQAARLPRAVRHRLLWAGVQRVTPDGEGPAGTLPGAIYADGAAASVVAAPWDGLALSLWADARVVDRALSTLELPDPTAPARGLRESTRRAVDALLACVDPVTGWPCQAAQWDEAAPQSSVWQHVTVLVAARSAGMLMRRLGDRERAQALDAMLPVMTSALDARLQDAATAVPPHAMALALGDGEALQQAPLARARALDAALDALDALVEGRATQPMLLPTLVAWQLLVATREEPVRLERARAAVDRLVKTIPNAALGLGGASWVAPDGTVVQLLGAPHAAAHATAYLMLLERHGRQPPAALPLPDLERCACPNAAAGGPPAAVWFLVVGLHLMRRVRRRGGPP